LGKYRRDYDNNGVVAKGVGSHLWKSVVKLWQKMEDSCFWSIGDGLSVKFCEDVWVDKRVRIMDLEIQIPYQWRHMKVSDFVDEAGRWNWNVLNNFLLSDILNRIAVVPPPDMHSGPDVKCCLDKDHGNLSIADMYRALCNFENDNHVDMWKRI
jgi:hypothetical protein